MIICVCNNVNETAILRAVAQGCTSFDDLQMELGVGACCGQCKQAATEVLAQSGCRVRPDNAATPVAIVNCIGRLQSALTSSLATTPV